MSIKNLLKFLRALLGRMTKKKPKNNLKNSKSTPEKRKNDFESEPISPESKKRRGMLHVKNDAQELKEQLGSLKRENKKLYDLVIDLYKWIDKEIGKDTIITMIYRTAAQQDALYSHSEKYKDKPWKSPHQFWHAVDLRTWIYTQEEIDRIVKYLNDKYNDSNYYKWTARAHEVGNNGMHFHINYIIK